MQDPVTPGAAVAAATVSNHEVFINKVVNGLISLTYLEVNTLVGDFQFSNPDDIGFKKIDPASAKDRMSSQVNLISGDITTAMTDKFVSEYKDLRDYHQLREAQGHDIICKNIEVLKQILSALQNEFKK